MTLKYSKFYFLRPNEFYNLHLVEALVRNLD